MPFPLNYQMEEFREMVPINKFLKRTMTKKKKKKEKIEKRIKSEREDRKCHCTQVISSHKLSIYRKSLQTHGAKTRKCMEGT